MKKLLLLLIILSFSGGLIAQIIDCSMNYYLPSSSTNIRYYNPATGVHTSTNINIPSTAGGLAVSNNLNGGQPSPTFYTVVNGFYWYYNGTIWVNTNHSSGGTAAVNPGGSGPYIYNVVGANGQIWRYDGTGNSVLVTTIAGFNGPYDIIGDADGNFYILFTQGSNQRMAVYSPTGTLICTYPLINMPSVSSGGGYSVVNGVMYVNNSSGTFQGTFSNGQITFSSMTNVGVSDYASCEFPPFNTLVSATNNGVIDACEASLIVLTGTTTVQNPSYVWEGPGIVSGANTESVTINSSGTYILTVTSGSVNCASVNVTEFEVLEGVSPVALSNIGPLCVSDDPETITAALDGGVFTASCGTCITAGGVFNPTIAGIGVHTVNFTVDGDCAGTGTTQVTVYGLPSINAGEDRTVCINEGTLLSATGGVTYLWSNGVEGNNTVTPQATTTYTVTGTDVNGCSNTDEVVVTVDIADVAVFTQVDAICAGDFLAELPTTSDNGILGTWSPAINNMQTTTYTFSPPVGECIAGATMTIEVVEIITPEFDLIAHTCSGVDLGPLPNVSINGLAGVWSEPINTEVTTEYIFTPDLQGCTVAFSHILEVTPSVVPTFDPFTAICAGDDVLAFPTLSLEGVTGLWSPDIDNTQTTNYIFTSDDGQCASNINQSMIVYALPNVSAGGDVSVCEGLNVTLNGSGAQTYIWSDNVVDGVAFSSPNGNVVYTVIGTDVNGCLNEASVNVYVEASPVVSLSWSIDDLCTPSILTINRTTDVPLYNCIYTLDGTVVFTGCGDVVTRIVTYGGMHSIRYRAQTVMGCEVVLEYTDAFYTEDNPIANFTIVNPEVALSDSFIVVDNLSSGAINYEWFLASDEQSSYEFEPTFNVGSTIGNYTIQLVAVSEGGCLDTTYQVVRVIDNLVYFIPNAFTPDHNERNNVFKPVMVSGIDIYSYNLMIFNRWGEAIYESNHIDYGWDGTYNGVECPDGSYTWLITGRRNTTDEKFRLSGHVTLIR